MSKKHLSSEVFYWDAPSRMLHKRDLFPLQVEIAGQTFVIPKWNMKYFKVENFPKHLHSDEPFQAKLIIRFRNFNVQFETEAMQIHYNANKKELVARFENIPEEHRELLHYFSEALETGDMVNIDNVLRRVDMPVDPPSTQLDEVENKKLFHIKRFLFSTAYVLIGATIVAFSLSSLQKKLTEIEITSAFVSTPVVTLQSPHQGSIKEVLISKGNTIRQGQPLLSLEKSDDSLQITSYRKVTENQKLEVQQALFKAEIDKKNNNSNALAIQQRKVDAANASLSSSLIAQQVKCNAQYASDTDRRNPHKRNAECNAATDKVTSAQIRVSLEKDLLALSREKRSRNNQSLKALKTKLNKVQEDMQSSVGLLNPEDNKKTILSKVSGKVISVLNEYHQYLTRGQTIAIIQPANSQQYIDAYITQEQAIELKKGDKATVTSPTFRNRLAVVIEQIEYTVNTFNPSNKELFNWSVPKENTVKLKLTFIKKPFTELPLGLPVTLKIKKGRGDESTLLGKVSSFFSKKEASLNLSENDTNPLFGLAFAGDISQESKSAPTYCKTKFRLFPKDFTQSLQSTTKSSNKVLKLAWKKHLLKKADKSLDKKSKALASLNSSGITDSKSEALKTTRIALRDADITSLLSLSFLLSNDQKYLIKAKEILLEWAKTYQPNGHPINESRLEGFLWSYDLLRCYLNWDEQETVNLWLKALQKSKHQWKFGPSSSVNNLKTHQLKILLMLDRLLDDKTALKSDQETLQVHLINNLLEGGVSFDYIERDALHYHVYNLEPWLEIGLLEPQYKESINEAYDFLIKQIQNDNIHNQFSQSKQKFDKKRAEGGFEYAKTGGSFKPERITRSVIVHSTLNQTNLDHDPAIQYLNKKNIKKNIFFLARDSLWKP